MIVAVLCGLLLAVHGACCFDMAGGQYFKLIVDDKMADFNCYEKVRSSARASWFYCRDWAGDCTLIWSIDADNLRNTSALLTDRLGKLTRDLKATFTIIEPPPHTCGLRNMTMRLDIRASRANLGYYVCSFVEASSKDVAPLSEESHYVRFAVMLPVRHRVSRLPHNGRVRVEFSVPQVPEVESGTVQIYERGTERTCDNILASHSHSEGIWMGDEVVFYKDLEDGNATYTLEFKDLSYNDAVLKFRVIMNYDTIIASRDVSVNLEPKHVETVTKDEPAAKVPSLTHAVLAEFNWLSSTLNLSFLDFVMLAYSGIVLLMTLRIPREAALRTQIALIVSCLIFVLVPEVGTVYNRLLSFACAVAYTVWPALRERTLCFSVLLVILIVVIQFATLLLE